MDKLDEIKDIMWRLNLTACNLIQCVDETMLDDLVNILITKFSSYDDEKEKYFPVVVDASKLQEFSIGLENKIIKYAEEKSMTITDEDYKTVELRNKSLNIKDIEVLRELKSKIYKLEKSNPSDKIRDMKNLFLSEYLINFLPVSLFEKHSTLCEYISLKDLNNLNEKINYLTTNNIDINGYLEIQSLFYDYESFYSFLRSINSDYKKIMPTIVIHGESIVDYVLQENLNYHMFNQRSGVFTLNFLTSDTIYHRMFQQWHLEETHDIRTTNVKSKRYYKEIK